MSAEITESEDVEDEMDDLEDSSESDDETSDDSSSFTTDLDRNDTDNVSVTIVMM